MTKPAPGKEGGETATRKDSINEPLTGPAASWSLPSLLLRSMPHEEMTSVGAETGLRNRVPSSEKEPYPPTLPSSPEKFMETQVPAGLESDLRKDFPNANGIEI